VNDPDREEPLDTAWDVWWEEYVGPRFTGPRHTYTPDEFHDAFIAGWEARAMTMRS
jgi:hypothetical protein